MEYGSSIIPAYKNAVETVEWYYNNKYEGDLDYPNPLIEDNNDKDWERNDGEDYYGHSWSYIKNYYTTEGKDGWLASDTYL